MKAGKLVKTKFKINEVKLGRFQCDLARAISGKISYYKNDLPIWREQYPELFQLLDKRATFISSRVSTYVKITLLNKIVMETGELVKRNLVINGIKIGTFQDNLLNAGLRNNTYCNTELPIWRGQYPKLFSLLDKRVKNNATQNKFVIKPSSKIELLNKIVLEKGKLVKKSLEIDGIRFGTFQNVLLGGQSQEIIKTIKMNFLSGEINI